MVAERMVRSHGWITILKFVGGAGGVADDRVSVALMTLKESYTPVPEKTIHIVFPSTLIHFSGKTKVNFVVESIQLP